MNNKVKLNMEIYEENFKIAKKAFLLNSNLEASACAAAFIGASEPTTEEDLKSAKKYLYKNTSALSTLGRGHARQVVAGTLAMSGDPEDALSKIKTIHKALDKKFFNSDYLVLAATIIYKSCKTSEYDRVIKRTREIYKLLKKDHPFLTGREDIANCAMMAISDIDTEKLSLYCESDFKAIKKEFFGKNKIQYLACVSSVFEGESEDKAKKIRKTYEMLKSEGVRFDSDAFSIISAIAMIVDDADKKAVIKKIKDTSDDLKNIRGMGPLGTGKRIRNLIASAIVIDAYAKGSNSAAASTAVNAIITAVITAELVAIAAASAAAASAAASSAN